MVEIMFTALQEQSLDRRIPEADVLSRDVTAWSEGRTNAESGMNCQDAATT